MMLKTIDHPLVADRLARLRDRDCPSEQFRQSLEQVAALMLPAVTADLETRDERVETPMEELDCSFFLHNPFHSISFCSLVIPSFIKLSLLPNFLQ